MFDRPSQIAHICQQFRRSGVERVMKRAVLCCCLLMSLLVAAVPLPAQAPSSAATSESAKELNDKIAQLDQRLSAAQSAGDNAWMLTSAALVLMMTGPGLALFYGGLVRRKNTLAIMMQ